MVDKGQVLQFIKPGGAPQQQVSTVVSQPPKQLVAIIATHPQPLATMPCR